VPKRAALSLLLSVVLLVSISQLDAVLKGMHQPAASSYGMSDLADVLGVPPDSDRPAIVVQTWADFDDFANATDVTSSTSIVHIYLVLDFIFIAAYAALLWTLISLLRARLTIAAGLDASIERVAIESVTTQLAGSDPPAAEVEAKKTREKELLELLARTPGPTWSLVALVVFDAAENILQCFIVSDPSAVWFWPLLGATVGKWLSLAAVLLYVAVAAVNLGRHAQERSGAGGGPLRATWAAAKLLRLPLLLLVAYSFGLLANEQFADVIRRWLDGGTALVAGIVATLVFSVCVVAVAHSIAFHADQPWNIEVSWPYLLAGAVALTAVGVTLVVTENGGKALFVPAGIAAVLLAAHALLRKLEPGDPPSPPSPSTARKAVDSIAGPLLGVVPLVVLGLALIRVSVPEVVFSRHGEFAVLFGVGLVVLLMGVGLWYRRDSLQPRAEAGKQAVLNRVVLWAGLAASILLVVGVWSDVYAISETLGTIGVFSGFSLVAAYVALFLTFVAERVRPPRLFRALRLQRIPVFVLLVLWVIVGSRLYAAEFHDVRTGGVNAEGVLVDDASTVPDRRTRPLTVEEAFDDWLQRRDLPARLTGPPPQPSADAEAPPPRPRVVVPFVLASTEGGGIRAAYWTALTLDCLFPKPGQPDPRPSERCGRFRAENIFALSGVSGGAVGAVAWAAHYAEHGTSSDWVDERLGGDFLAPTVAWTLFADLPNALLGIKDFGIFARDRAAVLERAWEREWPDGTLERGFYELSNDRPELPLLIVNGTSVQDGCRFNTSLLDAAVASAGPSGEEAEVKAEPEDCLSVRAFERGRADRTWALASSKDLVDYLRCHGELLEHDVRLSTAALLAARFPYVSPSGRITACQETGLHPTWVVDGGYFDNTGASAIVEIWDALAPVVVAYNRQDTGVCLEPFLLQIDNHYADPPGPDPKKRTAEFQVPLKAVSGVRVGHEANARQASTEAFTQPDRPLLRTKDGEDFFVLRYAHVYPRAHPGTRAPLGWTLSETSMEDLQDQLDADPPPGEQHPLDTAALWFGGFRTPSCG
jgi:hypothetical protein